jgi:hypothetical protein
VFQALPGATFIVNCGARPKSSALTSAVAQYFLTPAWSFTAKFDGDFASGAQTYGGTGTLRLYVVSEIDRSPQLRRTGTWCRAGEQEPALNRGSL